MKIITCTSSALLLLLFASCSSTVQDRIQSNQAAFDALPATEKSYVSQGRVAKGMSQDAVRIAWGKPDSTSSGIINNKPVERWIYNLGNTSGWSFGVGGGYGHGRSSGYGLGTGVAIPINQIPRDSSYVLFHNGKVTEYLGNGRKR